MLSYKAAVLAQPKSPFRVMASKDKAREHLVAVATELFTKHNVKQDEMFTWIREAITVVVASKPKTRVLYNGAYGGFDTSSEFDEYVGNDRYTFTDFREQSTTFIQPFGKYIIDKPHFEGLRECLYTYETSNLQKLLSHIITIHYDRIKLNNLPINARVLEEYLTDPDASRNVQPVALKAQVSYLSGDQPITWCSKYPRANLEELLAEVREGTYQRKIQAEIANAENAIMKHVSREVMEDLIAHYGDMHRIKNKKEKESKTAFVTMLHNNGYNDLSIWRYQGHYKFEIMTYIIKRNLRHDTPVPQEIVDLVEEKFGLVCASDAYCTLKIEEVPAGLSWRISEYDGLETVYIA
jgi:hypothetical protein